MSKIYIMGDVHGSFKPIRRFYNYLIEKPTREDTLIMLGDFGANFFLDDRDIRFKKKLAKYGFTYFIVRGNHEQRPSILYRENPKNWHLETYFGGSVYVENDYPYIKYAADMPFSYNINGHSTLIIPGAYSIDKYWRLSMGWSWFDQEQLTEDEMSIGRMMVKACPNWDLVLTHTCPIMYEPTDLFLAGVDQSKVDKTMEKYLGEIEYDLNYKLWCWGHYHADRIYPKDNEKDKLMLFDKYVLNLDKYFEKNNLYDAIEHLEPMNGI